MTEKHKNFKDLKKTYSKLYIATSFFHIAFALLFMLAKNNYFVGYNVLASILYIALAIIAVKGNNIKVCFNICFFEILIFSILGTIFVGYNSGFSLYILCIIPLTIYLLYLLRDGRKRTIRVVAVLIFSYLISTFISVFELVKYIEITEFYKKIFFSVNLVVSLLLLIPFLYVFLIKLSNIQNVLKKENKKLETVANYDPLTKLRNRRTFEENYSDLVKNKNADFCILMLDIDNFKNVNDTYGHDNGDIVLKEIASIIKSSVRTVDKVYRWGGEEILVIFKDSISNAYKASDRIRKLVGKQEFNFNNEVVKITITGGLAEYKESKDNVIKNADDALYIGKKSGKNKIVKYRGEKNESK